MKVARVRGAAELKYCRKYLPPIVDHRFRVWKVNDSGKVSSLLHTRQIQDESQRRIVIRVSSSKPASFRGKSSDTEQLSLRGTFRGLEDRNASCIQYPFPLSCLASMNPHLSALVSNIIYVTKYIYGREPTLLRLLVHDNTFSLEALTRGMISSLKFKAPKNLRQALPSNSHQKEESNQTTLTDFPSPLERSRRFPETGLKI
jgi:hypothetical protein